MPIIATQIKDTLSKSLFSYYKALVDGDLKTLSSLMTKESYIIYLEALGFKRAFKDTGFKKLLGKIDDSEPSLNEVETLLSGDLAHEAREYEVEVTSFESKGSDRVSLHYTEDGHPKKMYFSSSSGAWKIDYKAGRQKE